MPITETIKKGQIKRKVSASEVEVLHPETDAELVIYDNSTSELDAQNVQGAIDEVAAAIAEAGKVDDVRVNNNSIVSNKVANIQVATVTAPYGSDNKLTTQSYVGDVIDSALNSLDGNITGTPGAGKTLTAFSEADGVVTATFGNISITSSQVSDIQDTYSGTDGKAISGKGVKAALDGLTDTLTGAPGAGKTLTAFDEVGGKVTATFGDIQITESQVTNLTTDLANKLDDSQLKTSWSSTVSDSNIPSEKLVKNSLDNKLDKKTTSGTFVYSHTGSTQNETAVDTTVTKNSSNLVTSGAVWTAIDNLPEPMVFKGSVGDSGTTTWANLPTAAAANEGHTYKVITAHTADTKCPAAKVGDTIISNGSAWIVIPSGDEPSGTVTSVGLSLPSNEFTVTNSPVTSSGTLTGAWKTQAANKVFAGPASGSAAAPTFRSIVAADLPVASASAAGIVSTGAQTFAGQKTFNDTILLSGTGGAVVTSSGSNIQNNVINGGMVIEKANGGYTSYGKTGIGGMTDDSNTFNLNFPSKSGTLAITDDIPDDSNLVHKTGTEDNISGTKRFTATDDDADYDAEFAHRIWIGQADHDIEDGSNIAISNSGISLYKGLYDIGLGIGFDDGNVSDMHPCFNVFVPNNANKYARYYLPEKTLDKTEYILATTADIPSVDGFVTGPASATDNAVALFNGTTGKIIKNSGVYYRGSNPSSGSVFEIQGQTANFHYVGNGSRPYIYVTGGVSGDLGSSTYKWNNLYLSGNLSDGTNSTTIANIVAGLTTNVKSGKKSDGSTDITGNKSGTVITLGDSGITAGTYSAIQVNAKGIAVAGGQILDVIAHGGTPNVVNGGWYFEEATA